MPTLITEQKIAPFSIAIVVSEFNQNITEGLLEGAVKRLLERGFSDNHVTVVKVPGAVEIPLTLQQLARTQRYQALIALGAVIRGETSHYDYVCNQISQGCQQVMLENDLPVIFGVLTTEDEQQALERIGGKHGHKGVESADAAIAMVSVLSQI